MGLDVSHDCISGGYGKYLRWRVELCEAAGYIVDNDYRFQHNVNDKEVLIELLEHSDCDGEIKWEISESLANRLEELLPKMQQFKKETMQFISGLREAFKDKENIEYS